MKKALMKRFLIVLFVGVMGWASAAMSSPISYTFTEYRAFADSSSGDWLYEDIKPVPPVSAFGYASATASNFVAESHMGYPDSLLEVILRFTATLPRLIVEYDTSYLSEARTGTDGYAEAHAWILTTLKDLTMGVSIWDDGTGANAFFDDFFSDNGTTNESIILTPGHDYELFFSISCETTSGVGDLAFAEGKISNLQIDAVPISGTFCLLGSGLLSIIGWRRLRSK
jgi:hypothetical protein